MIGAYIFSIFIYKLDYLWELDLISLLKVNKNFKKNLYNIILMFYLSNNLKIKYDKKLLLNIKKKIMTKILYYYIKNNFD